MNNDDLSVHGAFCGTLIHPDGSVETFRKDNLVLNGGIDLLCACLANPTQPAPLKYIAVGTGTTSPANANTALGSEATRKSCTYSHTAGTSSFTVTATFNAGEATGALTEAGIVNASTGGTFFDRVTYAVVNKGANDVYTATFTITFSRG